MSNHTEFVWVAAFIVGTISAARIDRLFIWDKYPPSVWLRIKWDTLTKDGPWSLLAHCGYCFGLWAALFVVGWAYVSDLHWTWWLFNTWMAMGYLAAIVMAFDGDEGDED